MKLCVYGCLYEIICGLCSQSTQLIYSEKVQFIDSFKNIFLKYFPMLCQLPTVVEHQLQLSQVISLNHRIPQKAR